MPTDASRRPAGPPLPHATARAPRARARLAAAATTTAAAVLAATVLASCATPGDEPGRTGPAPTETRSAPAEAGSSSGEASPGEAATGTDPSPAVPDDLHPVVARAVADGPRLPSGPAEAARQLAATTDAVADPRVRGRALAAAAHQQQVAYRELGRRPSWDRRVLALLPPRLRADARDNVASRRAFRALQGGFRADEVPAWRIVRPLPAPRLRAIYREAERRYGVSWQHLAAINLVETAMGRIRGTSVAGAQGPMQFIPATWAAYGRGDVEDPRDAVMAAARYLRARGFTEPGGVPGALYAYNNDVRYVRGVARLAEVMQRTPSAYRGYWHWQVYYVTTAGDLLLPEGYAERRPVPVRRWLARG